MNVKVIIEQHEDGFIAYPIGLKGVVVAQGDSYDEALANIESAVAFHIETFGPEVFEAPMPEQTFITDVSIAV